MPIETITDNTAPEYQHKVILNGKTKDGSKIQVDANLHYLKGNSAPYFSITANGAGFGGCCHDEILEAFPELAPVVALHMSEPNGAPSHGTANGVYWIEEGKADTLANHLRISFEDAEKMIDSYRSIYSKEDEARKEAVKALLVDEVTGEKDEKLDAELLELMNKADKASAEAEDKIKDMRPRWKEEAKAAIEILEGMKPSKEPLGFYDQQALDFLTDHEAVISKTFKRTEPQKHNPELINDIYEVILCRVDESYAFDFHASHNDSGAVLIKYKGKKNDPFRNQEGVKVESIEEAEKMLKEVHRTRSSLFNTLTKSEKRVYRMINAVPIQSIFAMKPKEWITKINRSEPSDYSILSCLQKYEVGNFQNFINDFGYELNGENYGETMKTYQAVLGEYNGLKRLFSDDELEVMQEIQ